MICLSISFTNMRLNLEVDRASRHLQGGRTFRRVGCNDFLLVFLFSLELRELQRFDGHLGVVRTVVLVALGKGSSDHINRSLQQMSQTTGWDVDRSVITGLLCLVLRSI